MQFGQWRFQQRAKNEIWQGFQLEGTVLRSTFPRRYPSLNSIMQTFRNMTSSQQPLIIDRDNCWLVLESTAWQMKDAGFIRVLRKIFRSGICLVFSIVNAGSGQALWKAQHFRSPWSSKNTSISMSWLGLIKVEATVHFIVNWSFIFVYR